MRRIPGTIWAAALTGLAAAGFAGGASPDAAACRARTTAPGYRALFDGTQATLSGWAQAGPGRFELGADCTLGSVGGLGLLWNRKALSSPVTLRVEWMIPGDDNSGVFVGFPAPGNDPLAAVNKGYEVQIDATDAPNATTGAIYGFRAADQAVRDRVLNPPGRWNTFEITVDAPRIVVRLNGSVVNRFVSRDPARRTLGRGLVGLQNHSDADHVFFRSVQAKEWGASRPRCVRAAARPRGDEFRGRLDGCRWNRIVRYDGGGLQVSGGALRLELAGDEPPGNLVLQRAPASDWTIGTTVRAGSGQAGLLAYRSDDDWVRLVVGPGRATLATERCGLPGPVVSVALAGRGAHRLSLRRTGSGYTGFVGSRRVGTVPAPRLSANAAFGLLATDTNHASPPGYAAFDGFTAVPGRAARATPPTCK